MPDFAGIIPAISAQEKLLPGAVISTLVTSLISFTVSWLIMVLRWFDFQARQVVSLPDESRYLKFCVSVHGSLAPAGGCSLVPDSGWSG